MIYANIYPVCTHEGINHFSLSYHHYLRQPVMHLTSFTFSFPLPSSSLPKTRQDNKRWHWDTKQDSIYTKHKDYLLDTVYNNSLAKFSKYIKSLNSFSWKYWKDNEYTLAQGFIIQSQPLASTWAMSQVSLLWVGDTGGKGLWKWVRTCQENWRDRVHLPGMFSSDIFNAHFKCNHTMYLKCSYKKHFMHIFLTSAQEVCHGYIILRSIWNIPRKIEENTWNISLDLTDLQDWQAGETCGCQTHSYQQRRYSKPCLHMSGSGGNSAEYIMGRIKLIAHPSGGAAWANVGLRRYTVW